MNITLIDNMFQNMIADMQNLQSRCYYYTPTGQDDFATIGKSYPKFDAVTHEDSYEVVAAVPGYKREDFELEVLHEDSSKLLSLKSNKQPEKKDRRVREIHRSSFHRSIILPADADDKNITSSLADGLLTISIPRVKKQKQIITIN